MLQDHHQGCVPIDEHNRAVAEAYDDGVTDANEASGRNVDIPLTRAFELGARWALGLAVDTGRDVANELEAKADGSLIAAAAVELHRERVGRPGEVVRG